MNPNQHFIIEEQKEFDSNKPMHFRLISQKKRRKKHISKPKKLYEEKQKNRKIYHNPTLKKNHLPKSSNPKRKNTFINLVLQILIRFPKHSKQTSDPPN